MKSPSSAYTISDVDSFLNILHVKEDQIICSIHEGWDNLQCLKMALEIYYLRATQKKIDKLDFSSKTVLRFCCTENIAIVCDILVIASKVQTTRHFYDVIQYIKNINVEHTQDLLVYLKLVSTVIKLDNTSKVLDDLFIVFICRIILARNLSNEKNYFITEILKPYLTKNPSSRNVIITQVLSILDLYAISSITSDILPEEFSDSFWDHIHTVILSKNSHWDYKLALNILKTFIKHVNTDNFTAISHIIKGHTEDVIEFRNAWQNFFIVLETAEEKQLHLVQPSLVLLQNISMLSFVWTRYSYEKLLNHVQLSVAYTAGIIILDNQYCNTNHFKEFLQCLLSGVNKNDCSEYAIAFFQSLKLYINKLKICHYDILLQESAKITWTPFAAWLFYNNCVGRLCNVTIDSLKYEYIRQVLDNLKKLPQIYIRNGCFDLFYNNIKFNGSSSCDQISEIFKSYNKRYIEVFPKKHIKEIGIYDNPSKFLKLELEFSDFKIEDGTRNLGIESLVDIVQNPYHYGEPKVCKAYHIYNTYQDELYSKNILNFWTQRILTEKVQSSICIAYINHLCFYIRGTVDSMFSEKIKDIIDNIFATQHTDVSSALYKNLEILLKPFSKENSSLDQIILSCYSQLKNFKGSELYESCSILYFKAFFIYCDCFVIEEHSLWSSILDDILRDEVTAFIWLSNLPKHLELVFLPWILKMICFGECYTKQRRYEDIISHQIFLAGGILTGGIEPSPTTKLRLKVLQICTNLKTNNSTIWDTLLNIPCKRYFPDSADHICCLRSIQVILVLMQDVQHCPHDIFNKILWHLCEANHQPSVRQLMQWVLIKLTLANSKYFDTLIEIFNGSKSASALTAVILILYHVSLRRSSDFVERAIEGMLSYTTGAIFKLRVYSQVAIFKLISLQKIQDEKYMLIHKLLEKTIEENKESIYKVLQTDWVFFEVFDPEINYHLRTILVDVPKMNNVVSAEWQYIEFNLDKHPDYENILPLDKNKQRLTIPTRFEPKPQLIHNFDLSITNIQKKIIPLNTYDMETTTKTYTDLIVIASLVTSSANLGGLTRTCEIYGVKKLVVHDGKIVNDKEFKSLSMSSECWLNIIEVKADNLHEYIVQEKNNGYTAVGVEQTCESVKLNNYNFPEKCILLLGNEKEGISPQLLPYLDVCVEIPQFGVVRSLNVHVAGSTLIWEYVRQRIK